jgi:xanthine dehydrogenase YagT iron-sulfur-binding subunit
MDGSARSEVDGGNRPRGRGNATAPGPLPGHDQAMLLPAPSAAMTTSPKVAVHLTVNGAGHSLTLDPRTTLLDALRDHLGLTGTKKGCDHGQCGACTVLVNGVRLNACLSLAVMRDGDTVVTVEGLCGPDGRIGSLQQAFVRQDGFQCGYCTPGQICSAVGMLAEIARGVPSAVTDPAGRPAMSAVEVRERMSGNICRCAAYPNIVAAILGAPQAAAPHDRLP